MTMKSDKRGPLWLLGLLFCYAALLAALTVMNRSGADRWWLGAFNLYLPQVIWLLPGVVLTLICLKVAWRSVYLPLLCVAWVLGPILGFCWHLPGAPGSPGSAGDRQLRVMTWNIHYGKHDQFALLAIMDDIDRNRPDVVLLQAAGQLLNGPLGRYFRDWNVLSKGEYVIASRLPLSKLENPPDPLSGKRANCLRCRLQVGSATTTLYNVHFESPRDALGAVLAARKNAASVPRAIALLEENVATRLDQAQKVGALIGREQGPVLIAGDFNSTDASLVCANLRRIGLHDAFAEAGEGYGYTYGHFLLPQHKSWMRIDHIMLSPQLKARRSWTGTWEASDHRPVIADLALGY